MRLAIAGAARHQRADARRQLRIEKIDVERHVQDAVARPHAFDEAADRHADAEFVDLAHIDEADGALAHQRFFQRIDRADAEHLQLVRPHAGARIASEQSVQPGLAAQEGQRHAVHVAGRCDRRRVVIGMGIEPQHEQLAALLLPMPVDAVDRTHRQRVVAAHENRNGARSRDLIGVAADVAHPRLNVAIIMRIGGRRVVRASETVVTKIAVIRHGQSQRFQHAAQPRGAKRVGPHQRPAHGRADIHRHAQQGHRNRSDRHSHSLRNTAPNIPDQKNGATAPPRATESVPQR